jgi:hypothetical protein
LRIGGLKGLGGAAGGEVGEGAAGASDARVHWRQQVRECGCQIEGVVTHYRREILTCGSEKVCQSEIGNRQSAMRVSP